MMRFLGPCELDGMLRNIGLLKAVRVQLSTFWGWYFFFQSYFKTKKLTTLKQGLRIFNSKIAQRTPRNNAKHKEKTPDETTKNNINF